MADTSEEQEHTVTSEARRREAARSLLRFQMDTDFRNAYAYFRGISYQE